MRAVRWVVALGLCLFLTSSCRGPRSQRVCGILYANWPLPSEKGYLYLLEPDSGVQHLLAVDQDSFTDARLSPDGTKVLQTRWDAQREIWIVPLDGSKAKPLLKGTTPPYVGNAKWSFDGRKVAFSSTVTPSRSKEPCTNEFCVVDVANGALTKLPVRGEVYEWSPRDNRIAVLCRQGEDQGVTVIDTGTGELRHLTLTLNVLAPPYLAWSPDAKEIAVVRSATLSLEEIFLLDVATGLGRPASETIGYGIRSCENPTWSPDGNKMLFASTYSKGVHENQKGRSLFVLDLHTGKEIELAEEASDGVWSPDGQRIAFGAAGSSLVYGWTYSVSVSTSEVRLLTNTVDHLYILAWDWITLPIAGSPACQPGNMLLDVSRLTPTSSRSRSPEQDH